MPLTQGHICQRAAGPEAGAIWFQQDNDAASDEYIQRQGAIERPRFVVLLKPRGLVLDRHDGHRGTRHWAWKEATSHDDTGYLISAWI